MKSSILWSIIEVKYCNISYTVDKLFEVQTLDTNFGNR